MYPALVTFAVDNVENMSDRSALYTQQMVTLYENYQLRYNFLNKYKISEVKN